MTPAQYKAAKEFVRTGDQLPDVVRRTRPGISNKSARNAAWRLRHSPAFIAYVSRALAQGETVESSVAEQKRALRQVLREKDERGRLVPVLDENDEPVPDTKTRLEAARDVQRMAVSVAKMVSAMTPEDAEAAIDMSHLSDDELKAIIQGGADAIAAAGSDPE